MHSWGVFFFSLSTWKEYDSWQNLKDHKTLLFWFIAIWEMGVRDIPKVFFLCGTG